MDIILLERVEKLGQMGDRVKVKNGFARNFLLPQGKALRATKINVERFEVERVQLETNNLVRRTEAEAVAKKMDGTSVTLLRQASDTTQLYGSVNARDIAEAATLAGFSVDKRQVLLQHPIKTLGLHQIRIALHPEVSVTIRVNVARSEAEADAQASKTATAVEAFFEPGAAPMAENENSMAEEGIAAEVTSEEPSAA